MDYLILAADSKLHIRQSWNKEPFRGLIGVIIQCKNPSSFKNGYDKMISNFFERNAIVQNKKVFKASEIAALLPGPPWKLRGIFRSFVRDIFEFPDLEISVLFSTFDLRSLRARKISSLPEEYREEEYEKIRDEGVSAKLIQIYGEPGSESVQYVSISNFFEIIRQYFPIVCIGSLIETAKISKSTIIVDGCTGPRCGYWDTIITSDNDFTIAPHGDSYNYFISSADIITRWIDEELRQAPLPLNMNAMIRLLKEWQGVTDEIVTDHIHIAHLSNKHLGKIKPFSKQQIQVYEPLYIKHPIYFIVLEENTKEERLRFEHSPIMYRIHNKLSETDGSYIFWSTKRHPGLIRKGDVLIIYGEKGQNEVNKLIKLNYPIDVWNII